jgi:gamma-glutamylcyclotransferase (GGCT)/AIG2-like uncharacterized protein YtfP
MASARADKPQYLFVYGSLMARMDRESGPLREFGAGPRSLLGVHARLLGEASIQGRLYDLGGYCGVVRSEDAADRVEGELWMLADAEYLLAQLDGYEGIVPGDPAAGEYSRVAVEARLLDGAAAAPGACIEAWVYIYEWPVDAGRSISVGRWPGK